MGSVLELWLLMQGNWNLSDTGSLVRVYLHFLKSHNNTIFLVEFHDLRCQMHC